VADNLSLPLQQIAEKITKKLKCFEKNTQFCLYVRLQPAAKIAALILPQR
jgi:hypothetical protein